jgi:hypothetical protein
LRLTTVNRIIVKICFFMFVYFYVDLRICTSLVFIIQADSQKPVAESYLCLKM